MNSGFVLASLCLWQYFREGSRAPVRFQNSALASDLGLWFTISRHSLDSLETYPDLRQLPSQGWAGLSFPSFCLDSCPQLSAPSGRTMLPSVSLRASLSPPQPFTGVDRLWSLAFSLSQEEPGICHTPSDAEICTGVRMLKFAPGTFPVQGEPVSSPRLGSDPSFPTKGPASGSMGLENSLFSRKQHGSASIQEWHRMSRRSWQSLSSCRCLLINEGASGW